jgi:hypothetical protein
MKFFYKRPSIKIFYTSLKNEKYEMKSDELAGDLISLTTTKNLNEISGKFEIVLTARSNLLYAISQGRFENIPTTTGTKTNAFDIFKSSGLIDIWINGKEVMLGIVDSVTKTKTITDEGPEVSFVIKGRDLGAMLEDHRIWFEKNPTQNTERKNNSAVGSYLLYEGISSQGIKESNITNIITKVYELYFKDILNKRLTLPGGQIVEPFKYSDDTPLEDKLTVSPLFGVSDRHYLDSIPFSFESWNKQASIWEFFKSFVTPPFNEMFVDTGGQNFTTIKNDSVNKSILQNNKCHVISRPCPFDDDEIETLSQPESFLQIHDLENFEIKDADVAQTVLTRSKNNIPSVYRVYPLSGSISVSNSGFFTPALYDENVIRRYGYNPYEIAVEGIDVNQKGIYNNYKSVSEAYQQKLKLWFRNNNKFLTGTIRTRGNENYRVGNKLTYNSDSDYDERGYYYINGVTHNYIYGTKFESTLDVKRGVVTDLISEYKKKSFD